MRVKHGIEGAGISGVSIKHVKVSLVLFSYQASKNFLVFCAQVLERVLSETVVSEKLNSILEAQSNILTLELLEGVLVVDDLKFLGVSFLKSIEYGNEHLSQKVKDFEVVLIEAHLDIEACELTQVSIGV